MEDGNEEVSRGEPTTEDSPMSADQVEKSLISQVLSSNLYRESA